MTAKLTFGKSCPYHSGWQGWSNAVDVFLDGKKIGVLSGTGSNKSALEYTFSSDHPARKFFPTIVTITGLNAAKRKVRAALLASGFRETEGE